MENSLDIDNLQAAAEKPKKNRRANTVTNPVAKNTPPKTESKKSTKKNITEKKINEPAKNAAPVENPLSKNREIVARLNHISTVKSSNKMYGGYLNNSLTSVRKAIDYTELVKDLSMALQNKKTLNDLFSAVHNIFTDKLHCYFTAFGTYHEKSKCINLKLTNAMGSTYSSKIFLSESDNPVIECFTNMSAVMQKDNKFLNIPYMKNAPTILLPLVSLGQRVGVMILGKESEDYNIGILSFIANFAAMFMQNIDLQEKTNKYANTDTLTTLYSHRGFQEVLANEIIKSDDTDTPLSIVMFDINNISKINRELGHAKGDEVIKLLAEKIKQNIRSNDKAGRYGGDEIAVILPNTNTNDAKYLAECIENNLKDEFDVITWVPVSKKRYRKRGYDQAKILAEATADILGMKAVRLLDKPVHNKAQSTIDSAEKRRANVMSMYKAVNTDMIKGKRILVIVYIKTTVATFFEFSSILLLSEEEEVMCAALAKTRHVDI